MALTSDFERRAVVAQHLRLVHRTGVDDGPDVLAIERLHDFVHDRFVGVDHRHPVCQLECCVGRLFRAVEGLWWTCDLDDGHVFHPEACGGAGRPLACLCGLGASGDEWHGPPAAGAIGGP